MRSVRLDADLDRRVERAARQHGVSVSEFIRTALRRQCDETLACEAGPNEDWKTLVTGPYAEEWIRLLDGYVGSIHGDGSGWEDGMDDWARVIQEHNFRE